VSYSGPKPLTCRPLATAISAVIVTLEKVTMRIISLLGILGWLILVAFVVLAPLAWIFALIEEVLR
jgi:hypothetical protein